MVNKDQLKRQYDIGTASLQYIMIIVMAAYLDLVDPSELTYMKDSGKTHIQIMTILWNRIQKEKKKRDASMGS